MTSMEFEYVLGEESREWGWRAKCQPDFDPQNEARGIVHDFIDHGDAPNYGTVEGELIAFGCIIYSRVQYGSQGITEKDLASEIAGFVSGYWYGPDDCRIDAAPGLCDPLDPEDEALLRRCSTGTMKALLKDLEHMHWADKGKPSLAELVKCRRRLHQWLREGWQQAIRRFPTVSAPRLAEIFEELTDQVLEAKRGIRDEEGVGARMTLGIDLDTCEPYVTLVQLEDEYEPEEEENEEFA